MDGVAACSRLRRLGGEDDPGWGLAPGYGTVARTTERAATTAGTTAAAAATAVLPSVAAVSGAAPAGAGPHVAPVMTGAAAAAAAATAVATAPAASAGAPDASLPVLGAAAGVELSSGRLVRSRRASLRRFNGLLGPRDDEDRLRTVRTTPLRRCHRIAVIGLTPGAGRTTTAAVLGSLLAAERADRVIAVDADPESGTLGRRVARETQATVRGLVTELARLETYADIRGFTSRMPGGLEVLADGAERAADGRALDDHEYRRVMRLLGGQYPLVLTDSGPALANSPLPGVVELAHQLVLVATPSVEGAGGASTALSWLEAHGFQEQARRTVVVLSGVRGTGRLLRPDEVVAHFRTRCRGVVVVPYDAHLAAGGELNPGALRRRTRAAHLELASLVAEDFTRPDTPAPPGV
ncbi:MinD/ParA family protein [Streptomyces sp. NPDC006544]|uniref:MinD/ParA family ATP-binding protein n=1 Tax=Streptomyces sp. NPDC006544 TaxID=3154583 RepID=UPI0033A30EBA